MQRMFFKLNKEDNLLKGSVPRTFFSYLVPTIIGMLTNSVYCMVDVMFVGNCIGEQGLAAFNIAMPIFTIFSSVGLMLGVGGAVTISVLIGLGEKEEADRVFSLTVVSSFAAGMLMSVCGTLFLRPLSIALGATPELLPDVMDYLRPLQYIAVFYIMNNTMQVIIRTDYNPKLVMAAAVAGNGMNIFLDWLFVSVFGWGLTGASTATAVGPCVAMLILSFHYFCRKNTLRFRTDFFRMEYLKRIMKNGFGTFILEFSSGTVVFLFNAVLLRVSGQAAVAVYAVVSNIAYVGKGIFNGISQAAQPLISVNFGAGNKERIKRALRFAMLTAIVFAALCYILILLFPKQLLVFFVGNDSTLIKIGIRSLDIYFISFIFTGINTIYMYYFQSVESAKVNIAIALSRGIVLIAAGLLIFPFFWGETGVWLTITFAEVFTLAWIIPVKRRFDRLNQEQMLLHPNI